MCLDDVLGDEAATLRFRAFCRSLLAEHLVVFLLQLRPYHLRTDGVSQSAALEREGAHSGS